MYLSTTEHHAFLGMQILLAYPFWFLSCARFHLLGGPWSWFNTGAHRVAGSVSRRWLHSPYGLHAPKPQCSSGTSTINPASLPSGHVTAPQELCGGLSSFLPAHVSQLVLKRAPNKWIVVVTAAHGHLSIQKAVCAFFAPQARA